MVFRQALSLLWSQRGPVTVLTLMVYGPFYLCYQGLKASGLMPEQGLDVLFGLIGIITGPITNAAVVYLSHRARLNLPVSLAESLTIGIKAWPRLAAAYVAVSFVMLGYLVVTVLPGAILMLVMKWPSPFVLVPFGLVGLAIALPPYAYLDSLIVLDHLPPWEARQVSWRMTKTRRAKIIGFGLLAFGPAAGLDLLSDYIGGPQSTLGAGLEFWLPVITGICASFLYLVPVVLFYLLYVEAKTYTPLMIPVEEESPK